MTGVLQEDKHEVDENFAVLRITVETKEQSLGTPGASLEVKTFEIAYEWGPWVRSLPGSPYAKLIFKASANARDHGLNDTIVDIDSLTAMGWVQNPLRMYEKEYGVHF